MFQKLHAMTQKRDERGFTLIELLVVILIIAILAAIAIPVFLAQREKGWTSQTESALKNAATAAESYAVGPGDGDYLGLDRAKLDTEGFKAAALVNLTNADITTNALGTAFCIEADHDNLAGAANNLAVSSALSTPEAGTCAAGVKTVAVP